MINEKIAELYRQTEKQPQIAQERKQQQTSAIRWYQYNFVKKVIIFLCILFAISALAGIAFSCLEYVEMKETVKMLK